MNLTTHPLPSPRYTIQELDRVIDALKPYVSEERQRRIESAIASRTRDVVLVLEDVSSDHNASAVLRTADAFGVLEVNIIERSSRFAIHAKTSSGAHKWLELRRHAAAPTVYEELRERGYSIWASSVHGDAIPVGEVDVSRRIALVFGNEHEGLSAAAAEAADGRFRVPMQGFVESLNVSVATAVAMYDVLRRRRLEGLLSGLAEDDARRLRAEWYALSVRAAGPLLARHGLEVPRRARDPVRFIEGGEPDLDEEPSAWPEGVESREEAGSGKDDGGRGT